MTAGWLEDDDIADLLEGLGVQSTDAEMETQWPVAGLVHPDLTCITGKPEVGKSTFLQSMLRSILDGVAWMGHATSLASDARVLVGCEDKGGERRIRQLFPAECGTRRVIPFRLTLWKGAPLTAEKMRRHNIGLVVIDSVFSAVGDVNDQAAGPPFLSALRAVGVPVIVVHHSPAGGTKPAGATMYRAAYRNTITVTKAAGPSDSLRLHLAVSGNDVLDHRMVVDIDRATLHSRPATSSSDAVRRKARPTNAERVAELAAVAHTLGISKSPVKTAARRLIEDRPAKVAAIWGGTLPAVETVSTAISRSPAEWDRAPSKDDQVAA